MPARFVLLGTLFLTLLLASPVRAALSAFWRNNTITPAAIADDPQLATMQSWSVMITITEGMWASAGLRVTVPTQDHFYRNPNGGAVRPSVADQTAHPALIFHTYVTQPIQAPTGQNPPSLLGGFPDTKKQASFGGLLDTIPGTFSVAWGDPTGSAHSPGTYEIARLTFPLSSSPTVHPESRAAQIAPGQIVPIPTTIPEPTGSALFILMLRAIIRVRS